MCYKMSVYYAATNPFFESTTKASFEYALPYVYVTTSTNAMLNLEAKNGKYYVFSSTSDLMLSAQEEGAAVADNFHVYYSIEDDKYYFNSDASVEINLAV